MFEAFLAMFMVYFKTDLETCYKMADDTYGKQTVEESAHTANDISNHMSEHYCTETTLQYDISNHMSEHYCTVILIFQWLYRS